MPTDENTVEETVDVNASDSDASDAHQDDSETTDDSQESHQEDDEMKKKYAAARKGLDDKAKENKSLKAELAKYKSLAGDEEPEETEEEPIDSDALNKLEWKLMNKDRIDLVKEEYDRILEEGFDGEMVSQKVALELAERMMKVDNTAKRDRQASASSERSFNNRSGGEPFTENDSEAAMRNRFGNKKETAERVKKALADASM